MKKFNIHDLLLSLFIIIPFLPLKRLPFLIGNTYYFEIVLIIYGSINILLLVLDPVIRTEIAGNIRENKVLQVGLILLVYVFLNIFFSFMKCYSFEKEYFINEVKIHINIFRVFIEFFFIFLFFQYNLAKAGYFRLRSFITALLLVFIIEVIYPLAYFIVKVDWKVVLNNINDFYKFRNTVLRKIEFLPDGAYILFVTSWLYLFFFYKQKIWKRFFGVLIFGCTVLGTFFAFSRIFLPGFIFLCFFMIFMMMRKRLRIIFLFGFLVLLLLGSNLLKNRFLAKTNSDYNIGNGRFYVFGSAFGTMALENNIFSGVGFGNYYYYSYKTTGYPLYRGLTGLHNQGLTFLTGSGLLGYILFIYFLGLILAINNRKIKNTDEENKLFRQSLQGILYTFLMMGLFGDMLFSFHPPMVHYQLYVWISLSLMISDHEFSQENTHNPPYRVIPMKSL